MKYLMVDPRRLIVSREIGSRPRCVIFTVRKAVFIWGETEVIVPWIIVPVPIPLKSKVKVFFFINLTLQLASVHFVSSIQKSPHRPPQPFIRDKTGVYLTIFQFNRNCFIRAFHEKPTMMEENMSVRKLGERQPFFRDLKLSFVRREILGRRRGTEAAYLTSFILTTYG